MDGFETATIIKEREQSKLIPIIFITASVYDMETYFRGYTVGAVDYLRKPVDVARGSRARSPCSSSSSGSEGRFKQLAAPLHEVERQLRPSSPRARPAPGAR